MAASYNFPRHGLVFGLILILAQGCLTRSATPNPQPVVAPPAAFSVPTKDVEDPPEPWWLSFNDPVLNAFVDEAHAQNLTLAQALERIERADLLLRQARTLSKPAVDLSTGGARSFEWQYEKNMDGPSELDRAQSVLSDIESVLSLAEGGQATAGPERVEMDRTSHTYATDLSAGLSLRWELDFWGRLRSETRARGEEYAAALLDLDALRLSLSSQVAEAYYQALEQRLQQELLMRQFESSRTMLDLLELRFLQGASSSVDLLQQRGQLAAIESELPVASAQLRLLENRLDVLLGQPADGIDRTRTNDAMALPSGSVLPPMGVPVALLENRPDLKALQRRVVAADHRIASAMAERYPRISLGVSSAYGETGDAATFTADAAADLLQPIWDWGRRRAAVSESESVFRESLLAYSQAFLIALEEVENTLWQEQTQRELIDSLARCEAILRQTVQETRVRYGLGVTDYLPVLTAEQSLQDVQRELLRQRRVQVSLRIQLYRAIGGATDYRAPSVTDALARPDTNELRVVEAK